jgi:hypothetical protein
MIHGTTWQQRSVRDFFHGFAWQGPSFSQDQPTQVMSQPTVWQCCTVHDFFSNYNWQGVRRSPAVKNDEQIGTAFSTTLPVQQFFDCFIWQGRAKIAPVPQSAAMLETKPSETSDLKLSNFSDLF